MTKDISGHKYNMLTVVRLHHINDRQERVWECMCDCGNTTFVKTSCITSGHTKTCGCQRYTIKLKYVTTHGESSGHKRTDEYSIWQSMKRRCDSSYTVGFDNYGGRGIKVCNRWLGKDGYQNFLADMGRKPTPEYTLDRFPDKDGNYEPSNCRWATRSEQNRNMNSNVWFEYDGKRMILADWVKFLNTQNSTIYFHLNKGKPFGWIVNHFITKNNVPR